VGEVKRHCFSSSQPSTVPATPKARNHRDRLDSKTTEGFEFIHLMYGGEQVFVTYEARGACGRRFCNTEILTVRGAQITEVEVYFGWDLPHKAAVGSFINEANS
jgi:hypothetical protein